MFGKEEPQGGWSHCTVLQLGLPWGQNQEIKEEKQQEEIYNMHFLESVNTVTVCQPYGRQISRATSFLHGSEPHDYKPIRPVP